MNTLSVTATLRTCILFHVFLGARVLSQPTQCVLPTPSFFCDTDRYIGLCGAQFSDDEVCTNIECCCINTDETFASSCFDGDICCDGHCCDGEDHICCSGKCCDKENETCCRGRCTATAPAGITIALPVIFGVLIGIYYGCIICNGQEGTRKIRSIWGLPFIVIFGIVQVVVGYSVWDCSKSIEALIGVGFIYFILGFLIILLAMCQSASAGQGLFGIFAVERTIVDVVVVDQQGNVIQNHVLATQRAAQLQQELPRRN